MKRYRIHYLLVNTGSKMLSVDCCGKKLYQQWTDWSSPHPGLGGLYLLLFIVKQLCLMCVLQPVSNADFVIPVEIDGTIHQV